MGERRERTLSVERLVNLLPLVFGLDHRPRRGAVVAGKMNRELWQEEYLGLETFTLRLRLS